jgi:cytosine/adenosine deaminase-related metal-dependent hydrolase
MATGSALIQASPFVGAHARRLIQTVEFITIKNALIVTMDGQNNVFLGHIEIKGCDIKRITRAEGPVPAGPIKRPVKGERTEIDGNGCLALPGLVNGHIHSYRNVFRYVPDGLFLPKHSRDQTGLTPDQVKAILQDQPDLKPTEAEAILRLSYLEGIKAGVAFCSDFPQWLEGDDFRASRPFEIANEIGIKGCIRAVLSHDSYGDKQRDYFTGPKEVDTVFEDDFIKKDTDIIARVAKTIAGFENGPVNYQIGIWIPWETCFGPRKKNKFNKRTLSFLNRLIRDCPPEKIDGVQIVALMHHAELPSSASFAEFQELLEYRHIRKNLVLFHSIHIGQEDIDLIKKHKLRAVTCPKFSASRLSPIRRMLDAEIPVGLGTDFGAWDLFPAIGLLPKLHRLFGKGWRQGGLDICESLRMATNGGAQVYRVDKYIGSIEPEKRADIVLIDRSQLPLCLPLYPKKGEESKVVDQFVNWEAIRSCDVHTVITDGKIAVFNRKLERKDRDGRNLNEKKIVREGCLAIREVHSRILANDNRGRTMA